jgi:hypothetical protein
LRSLKERSGAGSKKPSGQGYEARSVTAPKGARPERKQKAGAEVLRASVEKRPDKMTAPARKAPER